MNSIIKILIYVALIMGVLSLLASLSQTTFVQQINDVSLWLMGSILPFRGIINLPAFFEFLIELMVFELALWTYVLLMKLLQVYTKNNLHGTGTKSRN